MQRNFREWLEEKHPEFNEALSDLFQSPASRRLDKLNGRDAIARRMNPAPREVNGNVRELTANFIDEVKAVVKKSKASSEMIENAARYAAGQMISPRTAKNLFMTAAYQNHTMATETVSKTLLSLSREASAMNLTDPTLSGTRNASRATREISLTESDRVKIQKLLIDFTNYLTKIASTTSPFA